MIQSRPMLVSTFSVLLAVLPCAAIAGDEEEIVAKGAYYAKDKDVYVFEYDRGTELVHPATKAKDEKVGGYFLVEYQTEVNPKYKAELDRLGELRAAGAIANKKPLKKIKCPVRLRYRGLTQKVDYLPSGEFTKSYVDLILTNRHRKDVGENVIKRDWWISEYDEASEAIQDSIEDIKCYRGVEGQIVLLRFHYTFIPDPDDIDDSEHYYGHVYQVVDFADYDYDWHNTLGMRAYKKKDWAAAQAHFKKSLEIYPAYRHANFNLACTMALAGVPFAEGRKYLEKVLEQKPLTKKYKRKIKKDSDLKSWRAEPAYAEWFARW